MLAVCCPAQHCAVLCCACCGLPGVRCALLEALHRGPGSGVPQRLGRLEKEGVQAGQATGWPPSTPLTQRPSFPCRRALVSANTSSRTSWATQTEWAERSKPGCPGGRALPASWRSRQGGGLAGWLLSATCEPSAVLACVSPALLRRRLPAPPSRHACSADHTGGQRRHGHPVHLCLRAVLPTNCCACTCLWLFSPHTPPRPCVTNSSNHHVAGASWGAHGGRRGGLRRRCSIWFVYW